MARYPGAVWLPIRDKGRDPMYAYNRVNLHTAVTNATSLRSYFDQDGIADSHFYVRESGVVEQYVDTAFNAFADLDGNDATISIETWDGYGKVWTDGQDVPPWNSAQMTALVNLVKWIMDTHGIPKRLATSSAFGDASKGLSWHRLGIDGNFPALPSPYAGRIQRGGGMRYSKSYGKVCPGNNRIDQIDDIMAAVNGSKPTPPAPKPQPQPKPQPTGLTVDGYNGPSSITRYQQILGTTQDGVISEGYSQFTAEMQEWLNARGYRDSAGRTLVVDGVGFYQNIPPGNATPKTNTQFVLQKYLAQTPTGKAWGYKPDGMFGSPSAGVKVMQTEANAGRLFK